MFIIPLGKRMGGYSRLELTEHLYDTVVPSAEASPSPSPAPAPAPADAPPKPTSHDGDPDEVDISQHFFEPKTTPRPTNAPAAGAESQLSDAALRNMMLGYDPTANPQGQNLPRPEMTEEDPMMKMLSQMMSGSGMPGFPPTNGSSPMFPGMPQAQQQQSQPIDAYTALWRLLHSIVAIGLGLYIAILTPFTGTKIERERHALSDEENQHRKQMFFWVFATAEACLLTTRLFLDKRRPPPTGIVWMVVGYLPEPFKGYAEVLLRYGQIFSTVRSDILACMFVLGVCAWWRG